MHTEEKNAKMPLMTIMTIKGLCFQRILFFSASGILRRTINRVVDLKLSYVTATQQLDLTQNTSLTLMLYICKNILETIIM